MKAVYAGTFDPVTLGHLDIIERGARLYDELYVTIFQHPTKKTLFTPEQRCDMLRQAVAHLPNVTVDICSTLQVNYARQVGAQVIIRGLRSVSDFEAEVQIAHANAYLDEGIEMVYLMSRLSHTFISSSTVKEMASHHADVSSLVPACVNEALIAAYR